MKLTRRNFLTALLSTSVAGFAGPCYMRFAEPNWFEITEKTVPLNRFKEPLRILHLSDFHVSDETSLNRLKRAVSLSLELQPDLAFITGDFITWNLHNPIEYRNTLRRLSDQIPVLACLGNHDGRSWASRTHGYPTYTKVQQLLDSSNVTLLFNSQTQVDLGEKHFSVVGLGDLWSGNTKPEAILEKTRSNEDPIFVLSHNPDSKSILEAFDWDLLCCGHTHGGQLVIPFLNWRPFLPVTDTSFPEGLKHWKDRYIHITRGIGSLHDMRFNCRPEISLLNVC
ncbi:MAG: phosphodiesterase YaeI [Verrucomicrobiota bacterium]